MTGQCRGYLTSAAKSLENKLGLVSARLFPDQAMQAEAKAPSFDEIRLQRFIDKDLVDVRRENIKKTSDRFGISIRIVKKVFEKNSPGITEEPVRSSPA